MRKQLTLVLMLALAIAMVGTALTYAGGRGFRSGGPRQGDGLNLRDSLTEEQQTALHEMVTEMREAGATREEIREARGAMLENFGVELPENWGERKERGLNLRDSLTEEQQTALHEMVTEMQQTGATREEIREARGAMLEGYGVELSEGWGQHPRLRRPGLQRLCADLTEEQRTAIRETVETLKDSGATREEIRAAVGEKLKEFGVELPEAAAEEIAPPVARIASTTAVQSTSWGQIKSRMK